MNDSSCSAANNPLMKALQLPGGVYGSVQQKQQQMQQIPAEHNVLETEFREFKNMNQGIDLLPLPLRVQPLDSNWVQEFSQMNLHADNAYQPIDSSMPIPMQQQHVQHQQQYPITQIHYQTPMTQPSQMGALSRSFGSGLFQQYQQQQQNMIGSMKSMTDMFDSAFQDVEKELQEKEEEQQQQQQPTIIEEDTNLANIALSVLNIMQSTKIQPTVSTNTKEKFQQSKFMNLMQRISNKEVELDTVGEKFVDNYGKDINSNDNEAESMFESAEKMGAQFGFQVNKNDWQGDFV